MPKVLITGVAGFLGAALAKRLLDEGWEVQGVDIVPRSAASRLEGLKIEYLWMALQDLHIIDAPYVVHAAAVADLPMAVKSPNYTLSQNVIGTAMLLEACARHDGFERILNQSSDAVYGYAKRIPIPEDEPLGPSQIYGASKASQEMVAMSYYHSHKLPVTILRSSTLFGVGMRLNQALPIFLNQALKEEPVTLHGDGRQSRDLNEITNMIDAILLALTRNEAIGQVFNIAYGFEISMLELAQRCIALTRSRSEIRHLPQRPGEEGIRLTLDIAKAKALLGYVPGVSFDDGLERTAEWLAPPSKLSRIVRRQTV